MPEQIMTIPFWFSVMQKTDTNHIFGFTSFLLFF